MSQSEDYLDGLLNSINRAKTDAEHVQENVERKQQEFVESRKAVNPDEDFFAATGIDVRQTKTKSSHPYLRKVFSEEDFLRKFEEELEDDDVDAFLSNFEQEIDNEEQLFTNTGAVIDSEDVVDKLINNIDNVVTDAAKQLDEQESPIPDTLMEAVPEEEPEPETLPEEPAEPEPQEDIPETLLDADDIVSEPEPETGMSLDGELKLPDDDDIDLSQFIEESDDE